MISHIVAMSENRVIGVNGKLPWHLSDDLKRFKALTLNHTIIMGRKTYDSIGKPLPQRRNIVVSRQTGLKIPGVEVFPDLESAIAAARQKTDSEIFVIGGGEIFNESLPAVNRIHLTLVHQTISGDAFYPSLEPSLFQESERVYCADPIPHSFLTLTRQL